MAVLLHTRKNLLSKTLPEPHSLSPRSDEKRIRAQAGITTHFLGGPTPSLHFLDQVVSQKSFCVIGDKTSSPYAQQVTTNSHPKADKTSSLFSTKLTTILILSPHLGLNIPTVRFPGCLLNKIKNVRHTPSSSFRNQPTALPL